MKVVDPGHEYILKHLDGDGESRLVFVKREGEMYPGNVGHHEGTNCQEPLRAIADRLKYVYDQIPDSDTLTASHDVEHAIYLLERRAARRHGRTTPSLVEAVYGETCNKCGHVGCKGGCHVEARKLTELETKHESNNKS